MTQRKPALATRVSPVVNIAVRRLTEALGITISEYLRKLILDDLESKKMFEDELKTAVKKSETNDHKATPESLLTKLLEIERENNYE
jgi:hypothetical protein